MRRCCRSRSPRRNWRSDRRGGIAGHRGRAAAGRARLPQPRPQGAPPRQAAPGNGSGSARSACQAETLLQRTGALMVEAEVPINHLVELDRDWQALPADLLEPDQHERFAAQRARLNTVLRERDDDQQRLRRWTARRSASWSSFGAASPTRGPWRCPRRRAAQTGPHRATGVASRRAGHRRARRGPGADPAGRHAVEVRLAWFDAQLPRRRIRQPRLRRSRALWRSKRNPPMDRCRARTGAASAGSFSSDAGAALGRAAAAAGWRTGAHPGRAPCAMAACTSSGATAGSRPVACRDRQASAARQRRSTRHGIAP